MSIYDTRSASLLLDLLFEDELDARCLVAPDGTVLRANNAWLRSTGFSPDDVLGANYIEIFPRTRDMALSMHATARTGHRVEVPRHAQFVNGRETWWEGRIDPVPMDGGTGLLITGREGGPAVSLTPGPHQADLEREALLRLALDAGQMVAWDYNPTTKRVTLSEYAADLLAVGPQRVGEPSENFLPMHPDDGNAHSMRVVEATKRGGAYVSEFRRVREDGEVIWLEERGRSVTDGLGGTRLVGITQNITERRRAAEELAETTERLQMALDAAAFGTYAFNPETGNVLWDAQQKRIWGLSPEAEVDFPSILARVHPEDREVVARAFEAKLGASSDGRWEAEYRIIGPDGAVRWLRSNGRVLLQGDGAARRAVRVIGVEADITASRLQEERLREAMHRVKVATEASHLGIHDYDVASGVIWWDARVRELWGVGPDEPITYESFMTGLHPDDRAPTQAAVDAALDPEGAGKYVAEYRVIDRTGRERWVEATGHVSFVGGKPSRLIGTVMDITDRKPAVDTAREAACTP